MARVRSAPPRPHLCIINRAAPLLLAAVRWLNAGHRRRRERDLYGDPVLRRMMAATKEIVDNAAATHVAPTGLPFPPFIVIERGESLEEWLSAQRGTEIDVITSVQMLQARTDVPGHTASACPARHCRLA